MHQIKHWHKTFYPALKEQLDVPPNFITGSVERIGAEK
jgi:hypothetical protein